MLPVIAKASLCFVGAGYMRRGFCKREPWYATGELDLIVLVSFPVQDIVILWRFPFLTMKYCSSKSPVQVHSAIVMTSYAVQLRLLHALHFTQLPEVKVWLLLQPGENTLHTLW